MPTLINGIGHTHELVRTVSTSSLPKLGTQAVVPLIEALHSGDPGMRQGAAKTLGLMASWRQEPTREDPNPILRSEAEPALVQALLGGH